MSEKDNTGFYAIHFKKLEDFGEGLYLASEMQGKVAHMPGHTILVRPLTLDAIDKAEIPYEKGVGVTA